MAKITEITFPENYSLSKQGLSQSLISNDICPTKLAMALNGYRKESANTIFGSMFHEVLDKAYNQSIKTKKAPLPMLVLKILKMFIKTEMEKGFQSSDMVEQYERGLVLIPMLTEQYFKFYSKDFSKFKWHAIEKEFEFAFEGVVLRGKIDGVFEIDNKIWLLEHKTKGRISDSVFQMLGFNFQNLLYITAFETLFPDKEIMGVQYNIIRNPQVKMGAKDKSINDFRLRVEKTFEADPAYYFMRTELIYTKEDKAKFKKDLSNRLQTIRFWIDNKMIYKNQSACENGGFACNYLDYCANKSLAGFQQKELFQELNEVKKNVKKSSK